MAPALPTVGTPNDAVTQAAHQLQPEQLQDLAIERLKWANRRKMAFIGLWAMIVNGTLIIAALTFGSTNVSDHISKNDSLLGWYFFYLACLPLTYMGVTVVTNIWSGQTRGPGGGNAQVNAPSGNIPAPPPRAGQ